MAPPSQCSLKPCQHFGCPWLGRRRLVCWRRLFTNDPTGWKLTTEASKLLCLLSGSNADVSSGNKSVGSRSLNCTRCSSQVVCKGASKSKRGPTRDILLLSVRKYFFPAFWKLILRGTGGMEPLVGIEPTTSSLPRKIRPFLSPRVARKLFIPIKFIWATVGQFLLESGDNGQSDHWSKRARIALSKTPSAKLTTRHQFPHLPRFLPPARRANLRP